MSRKRFLPQYASQGASLWPGDLPPEFYQAIGKCLCTWPQVEFTLGRLMAFLLKTEDASSTAMFIALRTNRARRELIEAVGKEALSGEDYLMLRSILNVIASSEKERADIAHGIFGSMDEKDTVAWASMSDQVTWGIARLHEDPKKHLYVYEVADVDEVTEKIMDCFRLLHAFWAQIRGLKDTSVHYGKTGPDLYPAMLAASPRLAAAMAKAKDEASRGISSSTDPL